jgi:predicted AlkP superfamily pyrophosphatase or phosphodiesterase
MNETISRIDDGISYLLSQLSERYLDWDIIIVSDHGMTNLSDDRIIYLDDMIDMSQVNILSNGPFMMIYPKNQSGKYISNKTRY